MFNINYCLVDEKGVLKFDENNFMKSLIKLRDLQAEMSTFLYHDKRKEKSFIDLKGLEKLASFIFLEPPLVSEDKVFNSYYSNDCLFKNIDSLTKTYEKLKSDSSRVAKKDFFENFKGIYTEEFESIYFKSLPKLNNLNIIVKNINAENLIDGLNEILAIRNERRKGDWEEFNSVLMSIINSLPAAFIVKGSEKGEISQICQNYSLTLERVLSFLRSKEIDPVYGFEALTILASSNLIDNATLSQILTGGIWMGLNKNLELIKLTYKTDSKKLSQAFLYSANEIVEELFDSAEGYEIFLELSKDLLYLAKQDKLSNASSLMTFVVNSFKTQNPVLTEEAFIDLLRGPLGDYAHVVVSVIKDEPSLIYKIPRLFRMCILATNNKSLVEEVELLRVDPNIVIQLYDVDYSSSFDSLDVGIIDKLKSKEVTRYFLNKNRGIVKRMSDFKWVNSEGELSVDIPSLDSWKPQLWDFIKTVEVAREQGVDISEYAKEVSSVLNGLLSVVETNDYITGAGIYSKSDFRYWISNLVFSYAKNFFEFNPKDKVQKKALKICAKRKGMGHTILGIDGYLNEKERAQFYATFSLMPGDFQEVLNTAISNKEIERYFDGVMYNEDRLPKSMFNTPYTYDFNGTIEEGVFPEVFKYLIQEKGVQLKESTLSKVIFNAAEFIQAGCLIKEMIRPLKSKDSIASLASLTNTSRFRALEDSHINLLVSLMNEEQKRAILVHRAKKGYNSHFFSNYGGFNASRYIELKEEAKKLGLSIGTFETIVKDELKGEILFKVVCGRHLLNWLMLIKNGEESRFKLLREKGFFFGDESVTKEALNLLDLHIEKVSLKSLRTDDLGIDPLFGEEGTIQIIEKCFADSSHRYDLRSEGVLNRLTLPDSVKYSQEGFITIVKSSPKLALKSFSDETLGHYGLTRSEIIESSSSLNYFEHLIDLGSHKSLRLKNLESGENFSMPGRRNTNIFYNSQPYDKLKEHPDKIDAFSEDLPEILNLLDTDESIYPAALMRFCFENALQRERIVKHLVYGDWGPQIVKRDESTYLIKYLKEEEQLDFFRNLHFDIFSTREIVRKLGIDPSILKTLANDGGFEKISVRGSNKLQEIINILGEEVVSEAIKSEYDYREFSKDDQGIFYVSTEGIKKGPIKRLTLIPVARIVKGKLNFKRFVDESLKKDLQLYRKRVRINGTYHVTVTKNDEALCIEDYGDSLRPLKDFISFKFDDYTEKVLSISKREIIPAVLRIEEGQGVVYPAHSLLDGLANEVKAKVTQLSSDSKGSSDNDIAMKFQYRIGFDDSTAQTAIKKGVVDADSHSPSFGSYHSFSSPQKDAWVYLRGGSTSRSYNAKSYDRGVYSPIFTNSESLKEVQCVFQRIKEHARKTTTMGRINSLSLEIKNTKKNERETLFNHEDALAAANPYLSGRFDMRVEGRSVLISMKGDELPETDLRLFHRVLKDILNMAKKKGSETVELNATELQALSLAQGIAKIKDPREVLELVEKIQFSL